MRKANPSRQDQLRAGLASGLGYPLSRDGAMQSGVISEEGAAAAQRGGLDVVMDRCLKVEHAR